MSDKLNTLEALRLASLKAKGYTAEQIAELSSVMEGIIKDINDSLKTCEDHVQSAHAPANAEENVIVSIQRNGQAIPPRQQSREHRGSDQDLCAGERLRLCYGG